MPPRIALFETGSAPGGFAPDGAIRQFQPSELGALRSYVPDSVAAPLHFALNLADQKHRGLLDLPALSNSVIIFTTVGGATLADHHRDLLWIAFGVPVFEQLRRVDGTVIARECEVHDGLHLDDCASLDEVREAGEIVREHCECGAETPRLRPVPSKVMLAAAC